MAFPLFAAGGAGPHMDPAYPRRVSISIDVWLTFQVSQGLIFKEITSS